MKRSILGPITIALALVMLIGCSSKLDEDGVNSSLMRFVSEYKYVRDKSSNTGVLGYVGPVVVKENEATVDFIIKYSSRGEAQEEKAVATFNRTQEGRWILAKVRGSSWGLGWGTDPGDLNWEVK